MMDINILTSNGVDVNKSLELFGNIETYNDIVGDFLIAVQTKLPKLQMYKDNKDMGNYTIYAHSLKSDARTFGFTRLFELALEHETKSKAGDIYYVYDHFDELLSEINKMTSVIKQYLGKEPVVNNVATPTNNGVTNSVSNDTVSPSVNAESSTETGLIYSNETILVVDDSNIIRNFVSKIFKENYEVGIAKDGKEAIDIISANKDNGQISAILLDLNMPNVDGFAVLEYMKENNLFRKMPVSIISGDSSKETIERAFAYHIVDMLGKPFNESDVKRVVEKTIYFKQMD